MNVLRAVSIGLCCAITAACDEDCEENLIPLGTARGIRYSTCDEVTPCAEMPAVAPWVVASWVDEPRRSLLLLEVVQYPGVSGITFPLVELVEGGIVVHERGTLVEVRQWIEPDLETGLVLVDIEMACRGGGDTALRASVTTADTPVLDVAEVPADPSTR